MKSLRVIYIDYNFSEDKYPNKPEDGDTWYTHGFGALYARKLKQYIPEFEIECWKADFRASEKAEKELQGVKFRMFPALKMGPWGYFSPSLLKALKTEGRKNPNTILNCSSFDHFLFFSLGFSDNKMPLVVQHHGESPAKFKVANSSGLKRWLLRIKQQLEKRALEKCALIYLLDPETVNWLAGIPQKWTQRSTGVDEQLFFPIPKREARQALDLNPDDDYLLYIGKLNSTKKPEWLIDAYLELKQQFRGLQLLLGGCSEKDPLYEKARQAGARIYGVIPQDKIKLYLSAASIYFLPGLSENHKFGGMGMLPIQAMLCNTPVIAGTLKCFPPEHRDKVGYYVKNYDELKTATIQILEKRRSFSSLRETALPLYSWKSISELTAQDYLKLVGK